MVCKLIHQSDGYEVALALESGPYRHNLSFIKRGSLFRSSEPEVKWQITLSTDELAILHHFLGRALSQKAKPPSDVAASTEGMADPVSSIEDFLSAWWNLSGGAHGTAHGWQMSAKRKGLDELLRVYQRTHQRLPQGLITFSYISLSSGQTVEETIDADAIHRRATILNACFLERGDYRLDRMVSAVPERPSSSQL